MKEDTLNKQLISTEFIELIVVQFNFIVDHIFFSHVSQQKYHKKYFYLLEKLGRKYLCLY